MLAGEGTMANIRLTDAAAQRLKAAPGKRVDYFDSAVAGLCLRVAGKTRGSEGSRSWTLFYRFGGVQKRLTLGRYPAMPLADARAAAIAAQAEISKGSDPAVTRAQARAEAAEAASRVPDTVGNVAELFIKRHLEAKYRAARYIKETRRILANHVLPKWRDRDIKTITRRDITELLDGIMDAGTPIAANRTLAAIRVLFNFALRRGIIESTPVALVERPGEETRRERTLAADEIRAIWRAAEGLGYPFGPFFEITLLTGQRRDEVARLRWADLDLEAQLWILSAEVTKPGRTHVVPLAPLAVDILKDLPRQALRTDSGLRQSPWVFTTSGAPISGFSKAKTRLDQAIANARDGQALARWRIHDIRRTTATELARLGVGRLIISKVLNHADRTVTGIYDRHAYLQEKRHALETWAQYLASLTGPPSANVMSLRQVVQ
jgi:integrase